MKDKLLVISFLGLVFLTCGCNKEKKPLLEKSKTREQAEAAIQQVEKLEKDMRQVRELERVEKESEKATRRQEPILPNTPQETVLPDTKE